MFAFSVRAFALLLHKLFFCAYVPLVTLRVNKLCPQNSHAGSELMNLFIAKPELCNVSW